MRERKVISLRGPLLKMLSWGPLALDPPSLLDRFLGSGPLLRVGSGPLLLSGSGPCQGRYCFKRLPSLGPLSRLELGPLGQIRFGAWGCWSSWVLVPLENLKIFRRNFGRKERSVTDFGGGDVALSLKIFTCVASLEGSSLVRLDGGSLMRAGTPSVWAGEACLLRGGTGGVTPSVSLS